MSPEKPVRTRIQEPREKMGGGKKKGKAKDFPVAGRTAASRKRGSNELALGDATYVMSVLDPKELPRPGAAEIAFAGRSNAGKSSAINTITGRKRLAYVSKTPGRTQLINFFSLGAEAFLVDLPGYGYADAPAEVRRHWEFLVGEYIASRESLAPGGGVMEAGHPLKALDPPPIGGLT